MRSVIGLLIFAAASIVPRTGSAQVSVTSPAAGAQSSYRKTVISWNPIPGASSYHLEIDDDANFGSPEVDVTVSGTSYALSGQRLKLNGRQSWAAYVRVNGTRWNANTFTPSYFVRGDNPALAVTSQNHLFLAFHDGDKRIQLTFSSDWPFRKRLSLEDTFNADPVNLAVDEFDVAHAFWLEQRWGVQGRVPYYTSSATGWDLVQGPVSGEGCSKGSSFAARGQFDIFMSCNNPNEITRWTITNGTQFAHTALPNSANTESATVARDGVGNVYVASSRDNVPENYTVLQGSGDGWIPHIAAAGRLPRVAVTREGELHALRWDGTSAIPTACPFSIRTRYAGSRRGPSCPSDHRNILVVTVPHLSWTQREAGCTPRSRPLTASTFVPPLIPDSSATRVPLGRAQPLGVEARGRARWLQMEHSTSRGTIFVASATRIRSEASSPRTLHLK